MKHKLIHLVILCITLVFMSQCGGKGKGIEVGNPNFSLSGQTLMLTPEEGDFQYQASFIDDDSVTVYQLTKDVVAEGGLSKLKMVTVVTKTTVQYSQIDGTINFSASFANGEDIVVTLTVDETGNVITATMVLNGVPVKLTVTTTSGGVTRSGDTNSGSSSSSADFNLGMALLKNRELKSAAQVFCDALTAEPNNVSLAFGCFWAKLNLLAETPEATALLAEFGEPAFETEPAFFNTSDGLFANLDLFDSHNFFTFNYEDFNLPLVGALKLSEGQAPAERFDYILNLAIQEKATTDILMTEIIALDTPLTELQGLLSIVLSDLNFSFTLPGELYYQANDLAINYPDVEIMMGALLMGKFTIDLLASYDSGIQLDDIMKNGAMSTDILLNDLNGTGLTIQGVTVDEIIFMTLIDADRIKQSRAETLAGFILLRDGLDQLLVSKESDLFQTILNDGATADFAGDLSSLIKSFDGPISFGEGEPYSGLYNMKEFFDNPPDASALDVSAGDPFVQEEGYIRFSDGYLGILLKGILELNLNLN